MSNQDEVHVAITDDAIVELQPDPGTDDMLRRMVEEAPQAKREAEVAGNPYKIYLRFLFTRGFHGTQDDEDRAQLTQAELDLTRNMINGYFNPVDMAVSDMSASCISTTVSETGEEQEWEILMVIQ